jgi:hypothetical protein
VCLSAAIVLASALLGGCALLANPPTGKAPSPPAQDSAPAQDGDTGSRRIVLVDQPWECKGRVDLDLVKVTMRTRKDNAINIHGGCTGRIGRVVVETWTDDGIKVHRGLPAPQDLVIQSGLVVCHQHSLRVHQDGVQVMAGERITFRNLVVRCAGGGNAQFFVGAVFPAMPTAIVCERCLLGVGKSSGLRIGRSVRSGARDTLICNNLHFAAVFSGSTQPVNERNKVLRASDARCRADAT